MEEAIEDLIRKVTDGQETVFDLTKKLDGDVTVSIGKRTLQPEPPKEKEIARAKARCHEFADIKAFAAYLEREGDASTLVLADVGSRTISAVLSDADDEDREVVTMKAMEHPLFTPWGAMLNKPIPVIDFSLFVMRNRRAVVEPEGRELALTFQQIS